MIRQIRGRGSIKCSAGNVTVSAECIKHKASQRLKVENLCIMIVTTIASLRKSLNC